MNTIGLTQYISSIQGLIPTLMTLKVNGHRLTFLNHG